MPTKERSAITRINQQLKAQGIDAQLVRGRGYYYLQGEVASRLPATALYTYNILPGDYAITAQEVKELLAAGDVEVTFTEL